MKTGKFLTSLCLLIFAFLVDSIILRKMYRFALIDIFFILSIYSSSHMSSRACMIYAFLIGIIKDALGFGVFGVSSFMLTLTVFLACKYLYYFDLDNIFNKFFFSLIFYVLYFCGVYLFHLLLGFNSEINFITHFILGSLITSILFPFFSFIFSKIERIMHEFFEVY